MDDAQKRFSLLFFYTGMLLLWILVNLLLFAVSVLVKRNLNNVPSVGQPVVSIALHLVLIGYALYALWVLVTAGAWLTLVLILIFGGFVVAFFEAIIDLIIAPFLLVTTFFPQKSQALIDKQNQEDTVSQPNPTAVVDATYGEVRVSDDPLYDDIVAFTMTHAHMSASYTQRRFAIGYVRALRILDAMSEAAILELESGTGSPRLRIKGSR